MRRSNEAPKISALGVPAYRHRFDGHAGDHVSGQRELRRLARKYPILAERLERAQAENDTDPGGVEERLRELEQEKLRRTLSDLALARLVPEPTRL